jgi:hypothetical protein
MTIVEDYSFWNVVNMIVALAKIVVSFVCTLVGPELSATITFS